MISESFKKKKKKSLGHHDTEVGAYIPTSPLDFLFSMFKFWIKADGGEPSGEPVLMVDF